MFSVLFTLPATGDTLAMTGAAVFTAAAFTVTLATLEVPRVPMASMATAVNAYVAAAGFVQEML